MAFSIDLFWSFRSPYCYLALDRLVALSQDHGVGINVRPIYPIAVRTPDFFKTTNPLYRPYHTLDSHRVAENLGVAFRRPIPDPIQMDMETGVPDPEQPYIFRLTRLGQAAVMAGKGLAFLDSCVCKFDSRPPNIGQLLSVPQPDAGFDPTPMQQR